MKSKNFINDHPLRSAMISKLLTHLNDGEEVTATKAQIENLKAYCYKELIRPLVVKDLENGVSMGILAKRYDVSYRTISYVFENHLSMKA
ncbi:MAG TPA: helix-turn-helix domain-containing protein [Saprospiraceae bacterium]|jgi:transcriptional regulator GlxA family with amidase domain|nr:helix-turn-helix domain-containing protein [Saprospiraceae bacterium]HQW96222.1 helix-turn-helix domain-containing protein [Saprospiraceae bacterium]